MRKFLPIWLGQLVASIGSGMTAFAVSIYIFQTTGSVTMVSSMALVAFLPMIFLSPIGGVLADRYDRRLMMILGDSLSIIGLLVVFIGIQTGWGGVGSLFLGVGISSAFVALLEPAYKATVTDILSEEQYARASAMVQIAANAKYLISPVFAALILSVTDIRVILFLDMGTILVTVLTVSVVRKGIGVTKKAPEEFHFFKEFKQGLDSITSHTGVRDLVILMGFMCFFVGSLQTLMTPLVLSLADVKTLGIMESLSAVGMLVGSMILGIASIRRGYAKILAVSLLVSGFAIALIGTTTTLWLIVVYCMIFFVTLPFVNTSADVLIRIAIPNELQGRAWGMIDNLTQLGYVASYALTGVLADYVFEPMLAEGGSLAGSIGRVIGVGLGRGIGFMISISGLVMMAFAGIFGFKKSILVMDKH